MQNLICMCRYGKKLYLGFCITHFWEELPVVQAEVKLYIDRQICTADQFKISKAYIHTRWYLSQFVTVEHF